MSPSVFSVKVKRRALRALKRLPAHYRLRVLELLEHLSTDPVPFRDYDLKKLRGFKDTFRVRIGDIRVVYTVDWGSRTIIVHFIGTREHAYKQ